MLHCIYTDIRGNSVISNCMSTAKPGRFQIPRLIKPLQTKTNVPFEKYAHFVVAPAAPPGAKHQAPPPKKKTPPKPREDAPPCFVNPQVPVTAPPPETPQRDAEVDRFIVQAADTTIAEATERFFSEKFSGACTFWQDIPGMQQLFCLSLGLLAPRDTSLPGFAFFSRSIVRTVFPTSHSHYVAAVDGQVCPQDSPVMLFPLFDWKNSLCSVVEVVKPPGASEFTEEDEEFVQYFCYKFRMFSRFLMQKNVQEPVLLDLLQLNQTNVIVPNITAKLANMFGCRTCEVWKLDKTTNQTVRFTSAAPAGEDITQCGIVGDVMLKGQTANYQVAKTHPCYLQAVDGDGNEAVLVVPVTESCGRFVYTTVLRGPDGRPLFTAEDEDSLRRFAPFVALAIANSFAFSNTEGDFVKSKAEREGLAALLEVAEVLSGQLDTEKLTEIIMEKGRSLTHADRCSLFLVNEKRDRLITSFQRGLDAAIDIPIDKGIAGETVKSGKVLIIKDAYEHPSFDSSTDLETGYRTRSILSVPIFNNRGDVIGVTEMVNKQDDQMEFTQWDSHMIQIFNVFCGISLENAKLYQESKDMSSKLRSFFDVSLSLSQSENIQRILTDIIHNARQVIKASRASLFLVDDAAQVMNSFITDGGKLPPTLPLTAGIAGHCAMSKECVIVNNAYDDPRFNRAVDIGTGFTTTSLCAAPILSSNGRVLGVVEMVNKDEAEGGFNDKDVELLKSFATFASVSLENSRLKDLASGSSVDAAIVQWISDAERTQYKTPIKLQLTPEKQQECSRLDFFAIEWKGMPEIQMFFYLFQKFHLLETFKVNNEMLFRYIFELRQRYNDVPYHNWIHAGDVTEYVCYELSLSGADKLLTPLELFGVVVAATAHDTNHDGFNNVYNVKTETPLGILFKDQSVMETHHCSQLIEILTKEETNLLHALSPTDNKRIWTLMIRLILATDMAHHFKLVKQLQEILDAGGLNLADGEHRVLMMQMLLKVADISNVSRPFETADKWCDVLCEEFFRQGDNEKKQGIELTSPLNDRENSNKPKSQIGFYNFICIPLYQAVARAFPPLEVNLNSVKANLEVWKKLAEES